MQIVERTRHPSEIRKGRSKIGISPGFLPGMAYQGAHLDIVQDLGAKWVRIDVNWGLNEPTVQGTFTWTDLDNLVAACLSRGLRILGTVIVTTPSWARGGTGTSATLPTDPRDLGKFIVACQNRYPHIRHWEIGNEVNYPQNTVIPAVAAYSGLDLGGAYGVLLRGVYPQMKVKDPDCTVITSGLGPTDTNTSGYQNEVEFLHSLYWSQGMNNFDAVGVHPYSQPLRLGELWNTDTYTGLQTWTAAGRVTGFTSGTGIPEGAQGAAGTALVQRSTKGPLRSFTATTAGTFTSSVNHGFNVNDAIMFANISGGSGAPFGGGSIYYVKTIPTGTTFTIAATQGGTQINPGAAITGGTVFRTDLSIGVINLATIRQVMTVHGDAAKKVWITEFGAHTGTGGVTQAEQVEQVKRFFAWSQSQEWLGAAFWFSAKDLGSDGAVQNSWGLQDSTGTNKTAYATFKALANGLAV